MSAAAVGRALVLLALFASAAGAVLGFATGLRSSAVGWTWTKRLAYVFSAAMVLANLLMVASLLRRDFSVSYVAQVGSRQIPDWVAVVSLWSSLEGSILFWGAVLGVYVAWATWANRDRHPEYMPWATGVWLACGTFFAFLLAGPAQPFLTVPAGHVPLDGPGPNPLLQNHLLMVAHPPCLYLGYVGMTIPFGLACAALLAGRLGPAFIGPLRVWLTVPWIFQTVAIMLGGWWAYEVLGWGGYWAWDPVENASLLPWLTATAALHSALLAERRGILKGWTVTLVLATYLLTILGTFMTRSGVFNSVHSFTQSPIGPTLLAFLALALVACVALLALRIDTLAAEGAIEGMRSRDAMFLVNNLLFVLFTFTVLVGTVFPLVVEAAQGKQMSVGRPYFDRMAVPLGAALLLLMGVGPALPWGRATPAQMKKALLPPLGGAALLLAIGAAMGVTHPWTLAVLAFGGYTAHVTLREGLLPWRQRRRAGEGVVEAGMEGLLRRGHRRFGGYLVHAGMVVVFIAIAVSSTMGVSTEMVLRPGESATIGRYGLTFLRAERVSEPHRTALVAVIGVTRDGEDVGTLEPRMNQYESQREPVGTPAVRSTLREDLYLSILSLEPSGQQVALHALVNPMVGWLWGAVFFMAAGGVVALLPLGRREPVPAAPTVAPALATGGQG